MTEEVTDAAAVLRALADPTRLRIFESLRASERCVRELCEKTGASQPLVCHHLGVLGRAGLVATRRWHGFSMYSVDPAGMAAALARVAALLEPRSLGAAARAGGNSRCCQGAETAT